jgi:hypothetical protein
MSKDLRLWTYPRTISILDESDNANISMVGNAMDIDSIKVVRYGDIYLAFVALMDNQKREVPQHTELIWSRDGLDWRRLPAGTQFIPNGIPGDWDAGSLSQVTIVPDGDRLRLYYVGRGAPQDETRLPAKAKTGLAFIGRDRFVGWQAGPEGGRLLTREFVLEGSGLEINCWSQVRNPPGPEWTGLIKAELLQPADGNRTARPYPGYAVEDCDPVPVTDNFDRPVTWKGSADLSPLQGKKVYIRFYIRSATLFSFRIGESTAAARK